MARNVVIRDGKTRKDVLLSFRACRYPQVAGALRVGGEVREIDRPNLLRGPAGNYRAVL
jgi:hypothetical protein